MGCTTSLSRWKDALTTPKVKNNQENINECKISMSSNSQSEIATTPEADEIEKEFPSDPLKGVEFIIPEDSKPIELSKKVTYQGEWANGRQHGVGETRYSDGSVYIGYYKDGKADGLGIFTTKDGSQYSGSFKEGKANGYGVYIDKEGSKYFGPYVADRREGRGREIQSDGLEYIGDYVKGNKEGKGKLVAPNGEMYIGDFYNNEIHGFGTYKWPDGRIYTGQWDKNRQSGKAEFRWPDGRIYRGYYKNGRLQGRGILQWPDGRKYDGEWKNGLQNGVGKYWGSKTWYREAQFLDGVRIKWLGEIVHVNPDEESENKVEFEITEETVEKTLTPDKLEKGNIVKAYVSKIEAELPKLQKKDDWHSSGQNITVESTI